MRYVFDGRLVICIVQGILFPFGVRPQLAAVVQRSLQTQTHRRRRPRTCAAQSRRPSDKCRDVGSIGMHSALKSPTSSAVLPTVDRETTIREDVSGGNSRRTQRVWVLSVVALLLIGFLLWKFLPRKPAEHPFETQGLKLVDTIVDVPAASFKPVDFLLPCSGTLSLELTCEAKGNIGVFVLSPNELARMNAKQTFRHLDGFDAHLTEKYRRTARLQPGKYRLVLTDKSSGPLGSARTPIHVHAHLSDLN